MTVLQHHFSLPPHYRSVDVLAFYQRDPHSPAEQVDGLRVRKGLMLEGQPTRLDIEFEAQSVQVRLDSATALAEFDWPTWSANVLGLNQAIDGFEQQFRTHPELGSLIRQQQGLRFVQTTTPFEALSWAIFGQQVSVSAALSVRRRFIEALGQSLPCGLLCYPDAQQAAHYSLDDWRALGVSNTKARALHAICHALTNGELHWPTTLDIDSAQALQQQLLAIHGIGPWTVNYTLMRGLAWLDGSVHGDAAVQRYLKQLLGLEHINAKQTQHWLAQFAPWRGLAAAHLWQSGALNA